MRFQGILGASPHSGKEGESLYALLGFKNPEKQSRKCKKKKTKTKLTCKTETKTALKKKTKTSKAFTLQSCNCTPKQQEGMGKIALWVLGTPTVFLLKNLHEIAEKWHLRPMH